MLHKPEPQTRSINLKFYQSQQLWGHRFYVI